MRTAFSESGMLWCSEHKYVRHFFFPNLITIQNFYENSSLQWKRLIFGNKCNKSQQMRLHGYLGSCDQGPKNVLSIAYRHNLNSLNCHNQSCLSWSFLHIDKMTKTCSEREKKMSITHIIIDNNSLKSILFFQKNMQTLDD